MASQPATVTATVAEEAFRNLLSKFEENFSSRGRFLKKQTKFNMFFGRPEIPNGSNGRGNLNNSLFLRNVLHFYVLHWEPFGGCVQCDQMAKLSFQCLATNNNQNLPKLINICPIRF